MRGRLSVRSPILALGHLVHQRVMVAGSFEASSRPLGVSGCLPGEEQLLPFGQAQVPLPSVHQTGRRHAPSRARARAASREVALMPLHPHGVAAQTSGCRGSQLGRETIQNQGTWGVYCWANSSRPTRNRSWKGSLKRAFLFSSSAIANILETEGGVLACPSSLR